MESIIALLGSAWGSIDQYVTAVLAILGGFSILAKITPTDKDDKFWAKAINFVGLAKKK